MPRDTVLDRFRAAASHHLAVLDLLEVVVRFERDHAIVPGHADMFHASVERLRETLKEAEEIG